MTGGNAIVLRATQVTGLESGTATPLTVSPTSIITTSGNSTIVRTPTASSDAQFTEGDLVGVGAGIGVPLLLGLVGAIFVIVNQRKKLRALRNTALVEKQDIGPQSASYMQSPPPTRAQPQLWPYNGYNFTPIHQGGTQGHFREMQINELDTRMDPQELGSAKPRD